MRKIFKYLYVSFVCLFVCSIAYANAGQFIQRPGDNRSSEQFQRDCEKGIAIDSCFSGPTPPSCPVGKKWSVAGSGIAHCVNIDPTCTGGEILEHDTLGNPSCVAPPVCQNGATNYPVCNAFPTCANGATNYPVCNAFPTCANGANNYPTCTLPEPEVPELSCTTEVRDAETCGGLIRNWYQWCWKTNDPQKNQVSGFYSAPSQNVGTCDCSGGVRDFNSPCIEY